MLGGILRYVRVTPEFLLTMPCGAVLHIQIKQKFGSFLALEIMVRADKIHGGMDPEYQMNMGPAQEYIIFTQLLRHQEGGIERKG